MNQDLKIIKKKYGENMAHLCRDYFPTILETEGLLLQLLLDNFEPNHSLYEDIIKQKKEDEFKNFIYSLVDVEKNNEVKEIKTPEYLLSEVGYDLYECKSEEDIQKFKKYYAKGEELCTFKGGRLDRCYVFFAVKKNVLEIKRENFLNPERQDAYGTSVISIQFTKDESHTLSIKNRYNHHVNNPDSTFSNNLDNIIPGLTESFGEHYGLIQQHPNNRLELNGYVRANDGKLYKYNQEINNIYYCSDNIIIDNFEVKRYDKEKYIIFDYFILNLVNKEIRLYDKYALDSFPSTISDIDKIEIKRKEEEKEIIITLKDNKVTIVIDKNNRMIKLDYPKLEWVDDGFLCYIKFLKTLKMPNLLKAGNGFLYSNYTLEELDLPLLEEVANNFLLLNDEISKLSLPCLRKVGNNFLASNGILKELVIPKIIKAGDGFLLHSHYLEKLDLPLLEEVGNGFLLDNISLKELFLPHLKTVGYNCLYYNNSLEEINCPLLRKVGDNFCWRNLSLKKVNMPNLEEAGDNFLESHPIFTKEDFIQKIKR